MSNQDTTIFGIDLGTTYSCIAYVDEYGKAVVVPNSEGDRTTPSVVLFEGSNRVVGKEAKNSALLNPNQVVEMVKRQMGDADWSFEYEGTEYKAEEISAYILRKLAEDAEQNLGRPVKDVVITCPAYFGIPQREATARAGQLAGFNVREIINEPTAAAIMYGLQKEQDQVVLVYDLGGGTFDVTLIEIKARAIRVIATGGDHNLGGRNWDEAVAIYLAEKWKEEQGSSEEPTDSPETRQDLWLKAETAKWALTPKQETRVAVSHTGVPVGVTLTRSKFNELTSSLLERTITYTKTTLEAAKERGFNRIDQILLVGGSTKMPQVAERLKEEFGIQPKVFEPDEGVAKGAAIYGYKLLIDEKIQHEIAEITGATPEKVDMARVSPAVMRQAMDAVAQGSGLKLSAVQKFVETRVTNVASHSFGIVATVEDRFGRKEVISNLVLVNDPLPLVKTETFGTLEAHQDTAKLRIMENTVSKAQVDDITMGEEIGNAVLTLPPRLPAGSPIEVTFELNREGRLHVTGRELSSRQSIEATIETKRGMSEDEFEAARARSSSSNVM